MVQEKLLIIGTLPPQIGGVTIHVQRLLQYLDNQKIDYDFIDYKRQSKWSLLCTIISSKVAHVHATHPLVRFVVTLTGKLSRTKTIVTYHADLKRFKGLKLFLNLASAWLSHVPIVLNSESLILAKKYNKNAIQKSSFIPPQLDEHLPIELQNMINKFRSGSHLLCVTQAAHADLDQQGQEVYSPRLLLSVFSRLPKSHRLIFVDLSKENVALAESENLHVPENVLFVTEPHSLFELIKQSDVMLRITTTDGDAISVKEALSCGVRVIATDCTQRPSGVELVRTGDENQLYQLLQKSCRGSAKKAVQVENAASDLLLLYKRLMAH